jgi:hypothetical protein
MKTVCIFLSVFIISVVILYIHHRIECWIVDRRFWKLIWQMRKEQYSRWVKITERSVEAASKYLKDNNQTLGA